MKNLFIITQLQNGQRNAKVLESSTDLKTITNILVEYAYNDGFVYEQNGQDQDALDLAESAKNGSYSYDVYKYEIQDYLEFYSYELSIEESAFQKLTIEDDILADDDFFASDFPIDEFFAKDFSIDDFFAGDFPIAEKYLIETGQNTDFSDFSDFFNK